MTPVREPLTSDEKTIVTDLAKAIAEIDTQFCCGGIIQFSLERKLRLLYEAGEERTGSFDLPPTKETDVNKLLDACVPSSHGRGKETVYDESYRLARELQQGSFALTADILTESGVLQSIATLTSPSQTGRVESHTPRNSDGGLVAHLYKLNAYGVGGFFKSHRDTPKSDRHVGTLVVALPIPFKGGALRVCHEGKEILFDWGKDTFPSPDEAGSLPWAFLFSDVEHEVLPVTSGTRVTLAYDIFTSSELPLSETLALDVSNLSFYSELKAALKNPKFLPRGGKLGVALSHSYPIDSDGKSGSFARRLKGSDASLSRALFALRIPGQLQAVYRPDDTSWELEYRPDEYKDIPDDEFGSMAVAKGPYGEPELLFTSTSQVFIDVDYQWEDGQILPLKKFADARVEPDIIWARKPSDGTFAKGGQYVDYGNEASIGSVYVAAALVFDIPTIGHESRASI